MGNAVEAATDEGLLVRVSARPARTPSGGGAVAGDKRAAIVRAATELFLLQGYQATRTEQIAAAAAVSKQTVYNQFGDKERLFREIVLGVTATAEAFAVDLAAALGEVGAATDLEPTLRTLARRFLQAVTSSQVLALRRLVIGEAGRFPELAATYHDRAPARVLAALAEQFERLGERGLLRTGPPVRAASDFAFLLIGAPLDEAMFRGQNHPPVDIDADADHAVDVFLAAYRTEAPSSASTRG